MAALHPACARALAEYNAAKDGGCYLEIDADPVSLL
jgi:hypothetical protein